MGIKKYEFCAEEILILREAMAEYKHFIKPDDNSSENRKKNYKIAMALHEQFKDDVRLMKI